MKSYPARISLKRGRDNKKFRGNSFVPVTKVSDWVPQGPRGQTMIAVRPANVPLRSNHERKYNDNVKASTAILDLSAQAAWTGTELDPTTGNSLANIGMGPGYFQRVGRKLTIRKVTIRGTITVAPQVNNTAAKQAGLVRLVFYKDTKTAGVQAQGEQVLGWADNTNGDLPPTTGINLFQNPDNFGRFQVIKDMTFRLTPPPISYDGTNIEQGGYSIPFKMTYKGACVVSYSTSTGLIADIVDNSFHLIGACVGGLAPSIEYMVRAYFDD